MTHHRVIPRDLFNESDLLKSLGKVIIHIDNGDAYHWSYDWVGEEGEPFEIEQDPNDGSIYCTNLRFFYNREEIYLKRPLNSRRSYAVTAITEDEQIHNLLSEDGEWTGPE